MDDTLSDRKSAVAQAAVMQGLLGRDTLLAGFVDLAGMRGVVGALRELGMACEVASPGELAIDHRRIMAAPAERGDSGLPGIIAENALYCTLL
jgi:hypothetical protein